MNRIKLSKKNSFNRMANKHVHLASDSMPEVAAFSLPQCSSPSLVGDRFPTNVQFAGGGLLINSGKGCFTKACPRMSRRGLWTLDGVRRSTQKIVKETR